MELAGAVVTSLVDVPVLPAIVKPSICVSFAVPRSTTSSMIAGQRRQRLRRTRRAAAPCAGRPRRRVAVDDGAHDARLDQLAAVGDRAGRRRHLQRRHADLVAHRDRGQRARRRPAWTGRRRGRRSRRPEVGRQPRAEAEALLTYLPSRSGAEQPADLDRADVARLRDHVVKREGAVRVRVPARRGRSASSARRCRCRSDRPADITFSSSAAVAVTILKVEPGSYESCDRAVRPRVLGPRRCSRWG